MNRLEEKTKRYVVSTLTDTERSAVPFLHVKTWIQEEYQELIDELITEYSAYSKEESEAEVSSELADFATLLILYRPHATFDQLDELKTYYLALIKFSDSHVRSCIQTKGIARPERPGYSAALNEIDRFYGSIDIQVLKVKRIFVASRDIEGLEQEWDRFVPEPSTEPQTQVGEPLFSDGTPNPFPEGRLAYLSGLLGDSIAESYLSSRSRVKDPESVYTWVRGYPLYNRGMMGRPNYEPFNLTADLLHHDSSKTSSFNETIRKTAENFAKLTDVRRKVRQDQVYNVRVYLLKLRDICADRGFKFPDPYVDFKADGYDLDTHVLNLVHCIAAVFNSDSVELPDDEL